MKIKKGDKVMIISGKDSGKTGVVSRAFPKIYKVLIEGVNIVKKHQRANSSNRKGQIVEKSMPIHVSNVQIIDPKTGKPSRVRIERENGKRIRVSVKSGTTLN